MLQQRQAGKPSSAHARCPHFSSSLPPYLLCRSRCPTPGEKRQVPKPPRPSPAANVSCGWCLSLLYEPGRESEVREALYVFEVTQNRAGKPYHTYIQWVGANIYRLPPTHTHKHTHMHTHTRTHARTHTHTHSFKHSIPYLKLEKELTNECSA